MAEYSRRLDKEAFDRENSFKMRMEGMSKFAEKYESEGAGKVLKEEQIKVEQMLLREQKKKEDNDTAKENKKAEDRKLRLQLQMSENARLLQQRREKERALLRQDQVYLDSIRNDVETFHRVEEEKRRKHKAQQEKYRTVLDDQMHKREAGDQAFAWAMADREKEINSALLKKGYADPKVVNKVLGRKAAAAPQAVRGGPTIAINK